MNEEDCRIVTYTGKQINPLRLKPEDIDIRDIAHSLACSNRFIGHTAEPISIAQHSVYVMALAEFLAGRLDKVSSQNSASKTALQGLFHDAPEYALGDVTKWLKQTDCMSGYREAEERAWQIIADVVGVDEYLYTYVLWADQFMVRYEAMQSWDVYPLDRQGYERPSDQELEIFHQATDMIERWSPWPWRKAEEIFLREYERLRLLPLATG